MERQFQPALDAYVAGGNPFDGGGEGAARDKADEELARAMQWESRSPFPLQAYWPVFHLARKRGLPLVALGVDRRDFACWASKVLSCPVIIPRAPFGDQACLRVKLDIIRCALSWRSTTIFLWRDSERVN